MTLSFRFGTVGSPISKPKKPGGSIGSILRLRELNFGAFELGWVRSVRVGEKTCAAIKLTGEEKDVLLSVHAPYFINLNANDEEWPKSRKRVARKWDCRPISGGWAENKVAGSRRVGLRWPCGRRRWRTFHAPAHPAAVSLRWPGGA